MSDLLILILPDVIFRIHWNECHARVPSAPSLFLGLALDQRPCLIAFVVHLHLRSAVHQELDGDNEV